MPMLYTQTKDEFYGEKRNEKEMTVMIQDSANKSSSAHSNAIKAEMKRRQEKKNADEKAKAQATDAQRKRREHRRCEREKIRIAAV